MGRLLDIFNEQDEEIERYDYAQLKENVDIMSIKLDNLAKAITPYMPLKNYNEDEIDTIYDVVDFLNRHKPKKPFNNGDEALSLWKCGNCWNGIAKGDRFCKTCGQAIKWD